jgi:hypothetical protein
MWPQGGYPCAGQTYQATIHSHTSDGQPQPDLKLAYAGSGPEAYAHLGVIQNQNYSESCANGASVPPPYTAQIKDTGTVRAFPMVLAVETNGPFSTPSLVGQIHLTPGQTWIDAGQTVIIDVIPQSWIGCKPGTYHFKIELRDVDWQGNTQDVIFTDTIT